MNDLNVSLPNEEGPRDHVGGEDQFLDSLREIWRPHCMRGLEVRHQLGVLLNNKLGDPGIRQQYGMGTIERASEELGIDKSDISRMRKFAVDFPSFGDFVAKHPDMTSWTKVRCELLGKTSRRVSDNRRLQGVLRSIESSVKVFRSDGEFDGPKADAIRNALQELFRLAQAKLEFRFDSVTDNDQQNDS